MPAFSPVAPVKVLIQLQRRDELQFYNLMLAHNIVAEEVHYLALAKAPQVEYGTVIVDNSVIELNAPVDVKMVKEASKIIGRRQLPGFHGTLVHVLPDLLLDCQGTIDAVEDAHPKYVNEQLTNMMFIPQGENIEQVIRCAEHFQDTPFITWIGVARHLVYSLGSRIPVTKALRAVFPTAQFHMLGFSRNIFDDIEATKLPGVVGIDSSMPLRVTDDISLLSQYPKRGDWWDEKMELTEQMLKNIQRVRKWFESK